MNAREVYYAIESGNRDAQQRALLELASQVQILANAVLEIAGEGQLRTGIDALTQRSRLILGEFIELPPREEDR